MTDPEIETPLDVAIKALEKLERMAREMAEHYRETSQKEDEKAALYRSVVVHLRRMQKLPP